MVFGNGVKNIQAAAYNGARVVLSMCGTSSLYFELRIDWLCKK